MSGTPATILVIEDEPQIRKFLRPAIEAAGFRLVEAQTGSEGLLQATQCGPDAIVLDLGLPDIDGLEVIRRIREWSKLPIIVLSARGQEQDKVAGLDAGADDYVQKPFSVGELMARIRVALRHAATVEGDGQSSTVTAGDLAIDLLRREVRRQDKIVHLTPLEYKLLTTLVRHAGLVLTHRQLLKEVWGPGHAEESHYIRIVIGQLRHKLEENPSHPRHLITETGVGYRFRLG
ncbi:MAG TPA: response regulator [Phycisphaerae bacterium]|nr:response regulator [Phycisphaerae bacterium]